MNTIQAILQDVRFALRTLPRAPAFTVLTILSLALGIGANTALFSLVDTLLLRSLAVEAPDRLVQVAQTGLIGKATKSMSSFAPEVFEAVREEGTLFSDVVGYSRLDRPEIAIDGAPEPVRHVDRVSLNFFEGLRLQPVLGRGPSAADDRVALLSDRLWNQRFEGGRALGEHAVTIDGDVYPVIGVVPSGFRGLAIDSTTDIWLSASRPGSLQMIGRLQPNVSVETARSALHGLFTRLAAERTDLVPAALKTRIDISPAGGGFSQLRDRYARALIALSVLVGLVLLITCANVGGLIAVRNHARRRELAVRVALGADRSRLIRFCTVESGLLSLAGAVLGLVVARFAVLAILNVVPASTFPDGLELQLDGRVLLFATAAAIVSALLCGLLPARRATAEDPSIGLRSGGGSSTRSRRFGRSVLATQVAIAVVLIAAAGLFLRTVRNLASVDLGFKVDKLLQVSLDTGGSGYRKGQTGALYRRLLEDVAAVPGVASVAAIRNPVLQNARTHRSMPLPGVQVGPDDAWEGAEVSPSFFETLGIEVIKGRTFSAADFAERRPVVVVSESFADQYFPNQEVVGVRIGGRGDVEIIGVVRDSRLAGVREVNAPMMYDMAPLEPDRFSALEVRVSGEPGAVMRTIQDRIRSIHPKLLVDIRPMSLEVSRSMARERLVAMMSGAFGALGLLLVAVGIYGVASSSVAQRTTELGIRMALGANRASVIREALSESARATGLGLLIGSVLAFAAVRLMGGLFADLLFGVAPTDVVTLVGSVLALAFVASIASIIPARRATAIDPIAAMRCE